MAESVPGGVPGWVDPKIPEDRLSFDPAASAGLFVGVSRFEDVGIATVPYAVDDAVDLAYLFVVTLGLVAPLRATLLVSGEPAKPESSDRLAQLFALGVIKKAARLGDVYDGLDDLAGRTGPRGLAILTLATHGLSDQGGDFLLASDSRERRQLEMGVKVPLVFDEVARAVQQAESGRALVLLDACRNRFARGRRGGESPPMSATFAKAIGRARGVAVLSGATLGGFTYDDDVRRNGVFTAAVLDGLEGQARPGPDGWITVGTLADFVQKNVTAWVRRHYPDDLASSRGIEKRIEATAEGLPLAPHPEATRERERYQERRERALVRMRENLGDVLDGGHWNQVRALLPAEAPTAAADRLLDQIEGLNGTELAQRGLRDYLRELDGTQRAAPKPPITRPERGGSSAELVPKREESVAAFPEAAWQAHPPTTGPAIPTHMTAVPDPALESKPFVELLESEQLAVPADLPQQVSVSRGVSSGVVGENEIGWKKRLVATIAVLIVLAGVAAFLLPMLKEQFL